MWLFIAQTRKTKVHFPPMRFAKTVSRVLCSIAMQNLSNFIFAPSTTRTALSRHQKDYETYTNAYLIAILAGNEKKTGTAKKPFESIPVCLHTLEATMNE